MNIHQLERESLSFFWKLYIVLLGYQIFLDIHFLIVVGILIIYTIFARVNIGIKRKNIQKNQYENLKNSADKPVGRWGV